MRNFKVYMILIILVGNSICNFKDSIHHKVKELATRARELYGSAEKKITERWVMQSRNGLIYPRGDKEKLLVISHLWTEYYECTARLLDSVTEPKTLPSVNLMVYEGSVAKLKCDLCISPDDYTDIVWTYAKTLKNLMFFPLEHKETMVQQNELLTIYNVNNEDAGVFKCQIGFSAGGIIILEVADDSEKYNVVKPPSSRGPYPAPPAIISKDLMLYTSWSSWSECSRCGSVGRRRKYGICFARIIDEDIMNEDDYTKITEYVTLDNQQRTLLKAFPAGIACRSRYLPMFLHFLTAVQERRNEIVIGMCKVPCKGDIIFELFSDDGELLEYANNTAGFYSMTQTPPPQPPEPVRDIMFVLVGEKTAVRCPGTTLNDIPVTWYVGEKVVVPRDLDKGSGSRVYLNARDHLIFNPIKYADANFYSCWQGDELAGTVKLVVWSKLQYRRRLLLLGLLAVAVITLRVANNALTRIRRQTRIHN